MKTSPRNFYQICFAGSIPQNANQEAQRVLAVFQKINLAWQNALPIEWYARHKDADATAFITLASKDKALDVARRLGISWQTHFPDHAYSSCLVERQTRFVLTLTCNKPEDLESLQAVKEKMGEIGYTLSVESDHHRDEKYATLIFHCDGNAGTIQPKKIIGMAHTCRLRHVRIEIKQECTDFGMTKTPIQLLASRETDLQERLARSTKGEEAVERRKPRL